MLPTAENYHCVGLHYTFNSSDFLNALVNFGYVHSTDDCNYVVFTCDLIDCFNIWNSLNFLRHFLRRISWVSGEQSYGLGAFSDADFDCKFSYDALISLSLIHISEPTRRTPI